MSRASPKSAPSNLRAPSSYALIADRSGEIGASAPFHIAVDGAWLYLGSRIERPEMIKLFAKALRHEFAPDGSDSYALVTPYERYAVTVEDAPFVAVALRSEGEARDRRLIAVTNVETDVVIGRDHPIVVRAGAHDDPRPYLALGEGLEARIARSVYYELAALAEPDADGRLGVWSGGVFFPLEPEDEKR